MQEFMIETGLHDTFGEIYEVEKMKETARLNVGENI